MADLDITKSDSITVDDTANIDPIIKLTVSEVGAYAELKLKKLIVSEAGAYAEFTLPLYKYGPRVQVI